MPGYSDRAYAESLAEFGKPISLPRSGGWVLERPISDLSFSDAMGCYPLFACDDWSKLHEDIDDVAGDWASLALVTDPFVDPHAAGLQRCFNHVMRPFKEHFVCDLKAAGVASSHHRYYARRALKRMQVEVCDDPTQQLGEWIRLYAHLSDRHGLKGLKAFSPNSFSRQLQVPGMVMMRAVVDGETIGAILWYQQGEVAYSHLTAVDEVGYRLRATYALYGASIEHFRDRVRWLDLGAGAGVAVGDAGGLADFKRGWADDTRTVWFCGRICNVQRYEEACRASASCDTAYFPAYRHGEFA